nr:hypothetical protein [Nannocystis sp.]
MMRTTHVLRTLALGAVVLGGCPKDNNEATATKSSNVDDTVAASDSASTTGGTTMVAPGTSGGGTTSDAMTDGSSGAPTTGACSFLNCGDMSGDGFQCDIWNEDCPEGQKCMPWDDTNMGSWNATKCSPVQENPGQKGDECTVTGSATDGIDSCDKHLLCWYVDDMNVGTCIDMCTGSEEAAMCGNGESCDVSNMGSLILCLSTCDPLVQSCPGDQICFFDGVDQFICDFDASGEEGQYGDACAFVNVCDYGLFCSDPAGVPDCVDASGCCSPYCDLSVAENTCPGAPMQECVPWYTEGSEPPGQENIGACQIPV